MTRIAVAGSLVHDMVAAVPHLPRAGEAVHASELRHVPGGKGFNQALAARRLGATVTMAGAVGRDAFGDGFCELLDVHQVDRTHVVRAAAPTGLAMPMVEPGGMNLIVAALGANLEPMNIPSAFFAGADVLLVQGELAVSTNLDLVTRAREAGVRVILNLAPSDARLEAAIGLVSCVVVNEVEESDLGGPARLRALAGQAPVVTTLGERGARLNGARFASPPVLAVDTTGAGDAFCAALAVRLAEGAVMEDAIRFAVAAGSAACTRRGSSVSMPDRAEVEALLR